MKPEDKAKVQQALRQAKQTARLMHTEDGHETVCVEVHLWKQLCTAIALAQPAPVHCERCAEMGYDTPPAPPPAQPAAWVGLTDEDLDALACGGLWPDRKLIARSVEAKLREKNGGAA